MANDEIAKRYAGAIYNIAKSSDSVNEVRDVLNILMENYEESEEFRKILEDPLKKFSKKGITVIISSHILSEIKQIADKIGIVNNGHLIYEGNNSDEMDLEKLFLEMIKKDVKNNDQLY